MVGQYGGTIRWDDIKSHWNSIFQPGGFGENAEFLVYTLLGQLVSINHSSGISKTDSFFVNR